MKYFYVLFFLAPDADQVTESLSNSVYPTESLCHQAADLEIGRLAFEWSDAPGLHSKPTAVKGAWIARCLPVLADSDQR